MPALQQRVIENLLAVEIDLRRENARLRALLPVKEQEPVDPRQSAFHKYYPAEADKSGLLEGMLTVADQRVNGSILASLDKKHGVLFSLIERDRSADKAFWNKIKEPISKFVVSARANLALVAGGAI
jgi:hypothetical protein